MSRKNLLRFATQRAAPQRFATQRFICFGFLRRATLRFAAWRIAGLTPIPACATLIVHAREICDYLAPTTQPNIFEFRVRVWPYALPVGAAMRGAAHVSGAVVTPHTACTGALRQGSRKRADNPTWRVPA